MSEKLLTNPKRRGAEVETESRLRERRQCVEWSGIRQAEVQSLSGTTSEHLQVENKQCGGHGSVSLRENRAPWLASVAHP